MPPAPMKGQKALENVTCTQSSFALSNKKIIKLTIICVALDFGDAKGARGGSRGSRGSWGRSRSTRTSRTSRSVVFLVQYLGHPGTREGKNLHNPM